MYLGTTIRMPLTLLVGVLMMPMLAIAQTREEKVRADREKVVGDGFWMYNDLSGAIAKAEQNGKPLLVVLRCIPCEECVKLDDELVDTDPVIRPLLEKFVCVRQVATNGLDLELFQYDTDQSFAIFMLNADGTVYGRFGTRSHRTEWFGDVSLEGLAKALHGALQLHDQYPGNRQSLVGKRGQPLEFGSPEKYPTLKDKFTDQLNYEGNVVRSCIHCHQIGEARREFYWKAGKAIPESLLFPYPHPKSIGLNLDPAEMATVESVVPGSVAAASGLRAGDVIESIGGQSPLSIADVQWVLHGVSPQGGQLPLAVRRGNQSIDLTIALDDGWRQDGDISWRVSTWGLRRMVTGGLVLKPLDAEQRQQRGMEAGSMALLVTYVGQYNQHAAAKQAGIRKDDVVVAYDGKTDLMSEAELMHHAVTHRQPGDQVQVTILRGQDRKQLTLPIQP